MTVTASPSLRCGFASTGASPPMRFARSEPHASSSAAVEQQAGVFVQAAARLGGVAEDRNRTRYRARAGRHAVQRARALEQLQGTAALIRPVDRALIAVQDAGDGLVVLRRIAPDVGGKFERATPRGIAQKHGDGERRVVEMPA